MNRADYFNVDSDAVVFGQTDIWSLTFKCWGSTAVVLLVFMRLFLENAAGSYLFWINLTKFSVFFLSSADNHSLLFIQFLMLFHPTQAMVSWSILQLMFVIIFEKFYCHIKDCLIYSGGSATLCNSFSISLGFIQVFNFHN